MAHGYSSELAAVFSCWELAWAQSHRAVVDPDPPLCPSCAPGSLLLGKKGVLGYEVGVRKGNTAKPRYSGFREDPVLPLPAKTQDSELLRGEGIPAEKIAQFEEAGK